MKVLSLFDGISCARIALYLILYHFFGFEVAITTIVALLRVTRTGITL